MIDTNAKMIQAYITLANTTLIKNDEGYVFDRLNRIDVELKQECLNSETRTTPMDPMKRMNSNPKSM